MGIGPVWTCIGLNRSILAEIYPVDHERSESQDMLTTSYGGIALIVRMIWGLPLRNCTTSEASMKIRACDSLTFESDDSILIIHWYLHSFVYQHLFFFFSIFKFFYDEIEWSAYWKILYLQISFIDQFLLDWSYTVNLFLPNLRVVYDDKRIANW